MYEITEIYEDGSFAKVVAIVPAKLNQTTLDRLCKEVKGLGLLYHKPMALELISDKAIAEFASYSDDEHNLRDGFPRILND